MLRIPSPIQKVDHMLLRQHKVTLLIKRDDLIHPVISGNKWRKLKFNIEFMKSQGIRKMVTFGGAYSNHIHAAAHACKLFGFESVGIIRGEELSSTSNETLSQASNDGMDLQFVSRSAYREFRDNAEFVSQTFPNAHIVPEGGANDLGVNGTKEIMNEIEFPFDAFITSIGTGTTFLGLLGQLPSKSRLLGISSLKGEFIKEVLKEQMKKHAITHDQYEISTAYSFGGYAKVTEELVDFINQMYQEIDVLFDPIYTGKAFFAVWKLISKGIFDGQTVVFLHTGGLQGITGLNQKSPRKIHF